MQTFYMSPPAIWPFKSPTIPASLMPSRNSYTRNAQGLVFVAQSDLSTLLGLGFYLYGSTSNLNDFVSKLDNSGDATKYLNGVGALSTPAGGGGGGGIISLEVEVSSAELLSCHTSPVQIIPAPGVGKFIALLSVAWQYIAGTTAYQNCNSTTDLYFLSDPTNGISDVDQSDLLTGIDNGIRQGACAAGDAKPGINEAVFLSQRGIDLTDGDGTLVVFVDYTAKTAH